MPCATISPMWRASWIVLPLLLVATVATAAPEDAKDPLIRARLLYNQREFDQAIAAAEQARAVPGVADSADLVAARAYLERHRESAQADDLISARERLRRINPERLGPSERVEVVIGLGAALYFEGTPGAAAAVFLSILTANDGLEARARDGVLDWWASALDREARPRPDLERQAIYQKILDRAQAEIGSNPASAVAAYWLAAAAAGRSDWEAAWDAAQAAWVRASLTIDHGAMLRADLDRLVQRSIAPERAKMRAQPPEELLAEWESFKEKWTH